MKGKSNEILIEDIREVVLKIRKDLVDILQLLSFYNLPPSILVSLNCIDDYNYLY